MTRMVFWIASLCQTNPSKLLSPRMVFWQPPNLVVIWNLYDVLVCRAPVCQLVWHLLNFVRDYRHRWADKPLLEPSVCKYDSRGLQSKACLALVVNQNFSWLYHFPTLHGCV